MDWSKTKTIFIIAFLVLDVFLAIQFFTKQKEANIEIIQKSPIQDQLKQDNITYGDLPKIDKATYITGKRKEFTKKEIGSLKNQTIVSTQNEGEPVYRLEATFDDPITLPETNPASMLNQFVTENILFGDKYSLWKIEDYQIIYFQQFEGKTIFQSILDQNGRIGMVLLRLNEKKEIVSYEQTMLEGIQEIQENENVLSALKAIEAAYNAHEISPNSEVSKVELGYFTHIPLSNVQIMAPTWHIVINEKEDIFVNASEGIVSRPD
ncbi:two-component system regulatory protein YycI [Metabacillus arenae]|uniref:Two-component system regulatory protein YycI n=1 Tax=Metabacillus arenae TaxID=2771434 RepID=A0A926S0A9_9BACI|nr:two-component system regulatory protein YycI [Metabacillus arenae]MBD1379834.1 two-component system regulatory protein YycI [Metabacillus arenae]